MNASLPQKSEESRKSSARLAAVQALYLIELSGRKVDKVVAEFAAGHLPRGSEAEIPADFDKELFAAIVQEASVKQEAIDELLRAHLDKAWPFERLEKILKNLLRAGTAEILLGQVDSPILINDYINVAHGFFAGKEPSLTNAVLDKLAKGVRG